MEKFEMDIGVDDRLSGLLGRQADDEQAVITKAAEWAFRSHEGQQRASGEPYHSHVLAVAEILNDLNLDHETIAAAMLVPESSK